MSQTRLFIGNVSYRVSEADIEAAFAELGVDASNVRIARQRETNEPRGFGFADVDTDKVEHALQVLTGAMIGDRPIRVDRANSKVPERGGSPAGGGSRRPAPRGDRGGPRERRRDDDDYSAAWRRDRGRSR